MIGLCNMARRVPYIVIINDFFPILLFLFNLEVHIMHMCAIDVHVIVIDDVDSGNVYE